MGVVPGREAVAEGKGRPGNARNFSHLIVVSRETKQVKRYENASKAEKALVRAWLSHSYERDEIFFVGIADTGQKHVIPWLLPNFSAAQNISVSFDDTVISFCKNDLPLIDIMSEMLTSGITKDELSSGVYSTTNWGRNKSSIRSFEGTFGCLRSSFMFGLFLWLAQRDETLVAERLKRENEHRAARKKPAAVAKPALGEDGNSHRGSPVVVQAAGHDDERIQPAEVLGAASGQGQDGDTKINQPRGVGNRPSKKPKAGEPDSLYLFSID